MRWLGRLTQKGKTSGTGLAERSCEDARTAPDRGTAGHRSLRFWLQPRRLRFGGMNE